MLDYQKIVDEFGYIDADVLVDALPMLIQSDPVLATLMRDFSPVPVQSPDFKWRNGVMKPRVFTVNGESVEERTKIIFDDATGIAVDDLFRFETSAGASLDVQLRVTSLNPDGDNANEVGVALHGSEDEDIPDNAVATFLNRANDEISDITDTPMEEGPEKENYCQMLMADAPVSLMAALSRDSYGDNPQELKNEVAAQDMLRQINNMLIYGKKWKPNGGNKRVSGGILYWIKEAAGQNLLDESGGAFDSDTLDNIVAKGIAAGATNIDAFVMAPNQAIKAKNLISDDVRYVQGANEAGLRVERLRSPIQYKGINVASIVVDPNFPKDKILAVDGTRVGLRQMLPLTKVRVPTSKTQVVDRFIAILGAVVKDAGNAHVLVENLAV